MILCCCAPKAEKPVRKVLHGGKIFCLQARSSGIKWFSHYHLQQKNAGNETAVSQPVIKSMFLKKRHPDLCRYIKNRSAMLISHLAAILTIRLRISGRPIVT